MNITVLTPERALFEGAIVSVKVPGVAGEFQILQNHAPIVSALEAGKVTIVTADGVHRFFDEASGDLVEAQEAGKRLEYQVEGGFVEVLGNEVSLLIAGTV